MVKRSRKEFHARAESLCGFDDCINPDHLELVSYRELCQADVQARRKMQGRGSWGAIGMEMARKQTP